MPETLFHKGLNPKGLPEHTPDLVALVDAVELHANSCNRLDLERQSNVVSNSLVVHRLMRGAKCQKWLYDVMDGECRAWTLVTGGGHDHAKAMQNIAHTVVGAHQERVEAGTAVDSDLCHNEKRGRFFSGLPAKFR